MFLFITVYFVRRGQRYRPPQGCVVDQLRRCNINPNFRQGGGTGGGLEHLPPTAAGLGYAAPHNKPLRVENVGGVADAAGGKY